MWYDEDEARAREEDYDELVRELVHVPDDVRNTVASFLQDLRRAGVDWYYLVGNGDEFGLDFDDFQEERFFRQLAGPCTRATRIPGSASLKFAYENGAQWDEYTCAFAALYGNLECLKYAHEDGCRWDWTTCAYAAKNGHLECLQYARENGCPWNKETCRDAACNGHLECLKYARENECPWDENTCRDAALGGHLEMLKYVCAQGCPGSAPYAEALNEVVIPDADERFGLAVALVFQQNNGQISMRDFLPLWAEHRDVYREPHLEAIRTACKHHFVEKHKKFLIQSFYESFPFRV